MHDMTDSTRWKPRKKSQASLSNVLRQMMRANLVNRSRIKNASHFKHAWNAKWIYDNKTRKHISNHEPWCRMVVFDASRRILSADPRSSSDTRIEKRGSKRTIAKHSRNSNWMWIYCFVISKRRMWMTFQAFCFPLLDIPLIAEYA